MHIVLLALGYLVVGGIVEWKTKAKKDAIIAFYKLPDKVAKFYLVLAAVAWPATLYAALKNK